MTTRTVEDLLSIAGPPAALRGRWRGCLPASRTDAAHLAGLLESDNEALLGANAEDCAEARASGLSEAMIDRLLLTHDRLCGTARSSARWPPCLTRWARPSR